MKEENQGKTKSSIGLGIVFGLIVWAALGLIFFPENLIISAWIGMSAGIVIAATIDSLASKSHNNHF